MRKMNVVLALMVAGIMLLPFAAGAAEIVNIDFESAGGYTLDADIPTGSPLSGGEQWALDPSDGSAGSVKIKAPVAPTPSQWDSQCMEYECTSTAYMDFKESNTLTTGYSDLTLECDLILVDIPAQNFQICLLNADAEDNDVCKAIVRNDMFALSCGDGNQKGGEATAVNTLYRVSLSYKSGTGVWMKISKDPYGTNVEVWDPGVFTESHSGPVAGFSVYTGNLSHAQIDNIRVISPSGTTSVDEWRLY